jgi:N-acyl-D-aspartate/D-glutamate deacylase
MNIEKALEIVENYRDSWGYAGLLETMEGMQAANLRDELTENESRAFRTAFREFSKLFATV